MRESFTVESGHTVSVGSVVGQKFRERIQIVVFSKFSSKTPEASKIWTLRNMDSGPLLNLRYPSVFPDVVPPKAVHDAAGVDVRQWEWRAP